jgi:hypothetical protein
VEANPILAGRFISWKSPEFVFFRAIYFNNYIYGGFHKWWYPIAGWFIMENP